MVTVRPCLLAALFLSACSSAPKPLPEAGVDGRLHAWFWDSPAQAPTELSAQGIEGLGDDRFVLQAPLLRRPLAEGGFLTLVAPAGNITGARSGQVQIQVDPPVTVAGVLSGKPMAGVADAVILNPKAGTWALVRLDATWGSQRVGAARLECDADGAWHATDLRVSPAGAGVAASVAGLVP